MTRRAIRWRLRKAGLGALPVLAGVLMASGLLRLSDGAGQAIAREFVSLGDAAAEGADPCGTDPDIATVLDALDARSQRLDSAEADLVTRQSALAEARDEIRSQMDALAAAEAELEELLDLAETASETDLAKLTAVYETMKPKEASALFSEMAPQFAAGFLARMRADAAAAILAGLDPATAYSISVLMAGRNADIPDE